MAERKELFFKNNADELKYIFCKKKRPFVLFVGAGINCAYENMDWNSLLNSLLKNAVSILTVSEGLDSTEKKEILDFLMDKDTENKKGFISNYNTYFKASIIKNVLGNQYITFIQNHIYSNCNRDIIKKSLNKKSSDKNFLLEIAGLILQCPNIAAVVTYNYDNFLGTAIELLQEKGNRYQRFLNPIDIFRSIQKNTHDTETFPIYHVHGYIPPPNMVQVMPAENVVLAYDEYFHNIMEPYSWQTTTQLHFLNNYNILFLGASLSDWNMLRALSTSEKYSKAVKRFALFANSNFPWGNKKSMFLNRLNSTVYEDVGIKPIYTETNNYIELPEFISSLYNPKT